MVKLELKDCAMSDKKRSLDGAQKACGCNIFDPSCKHEEHCAMSNQPTPDHKIDTDFLDMIDDIAAVREVLVYAGRAENAAFDRIVTRLLK